MRDTGAITMLFRARKIEAGHSTSEVPRPNLAIAGTEGLISTDARGTVLGGIIPGKMAAPYPLLAGDGVALAGSVAAGRGLLCEADVLELKQSLARLHPAVRLEQVRQGVDVFEGSAQRQLLTGTFLDYPATCTRWHINATWSKKIIDALLGGAVIAAIVALVLAALAESGITAPGAIAALIAAALLMAGAATIMLMVILSGGVGFDIHWVASFPVPKPCDPGLHTD